MGRSGLSPAWVAAAVMFCALILVVARTGADLFWLALAASAGTLVLGLATARQAGQLKRIRQMLIAGGWLEAKARDGALFDAIGHLVAQAGAHQHRWNGLHPHTGLPVRETLLAAIAEDIADAPAAMLLGTVRFADHGRLCAFDPDGAEAALRAFAERLVASIGDSRPIAHVDRDCFAIWFRGSDAQGAEAALRALRYALSGELVAGGMKIVPEIEIGRALFPADGTDPAALVTRALVSLAKPGAQDGDVAPGRAAHAARERFSLEQDLRHAVARDQLRLHFQPVVDLARGRLLGAEALLRWQHPEAGMVSPARFIPILEDANLTAEIGMWTFDAACRAMRDWQRRGLADLKVAVNLSARQLRDPALAGAIARTLARHRLRPEALELELTETAATEDSARTFALFTQLRATGISLAIDDFGSGYSSLSYLKNLPFDKLKIDREFVTDVHRRPDSQAICRSLVALTRGLSLSILAEGVETREEVDALRGLGCDIFQGYFFSHPLPSDAFVRLAHDPAWRQMLQSPALALQTDLKNRMTA